MNLMYYTTEFIKNKNKFYFRPYQNWVQKKQKWLTVKF